jgi:sodium-dependent dicarboxylate transporter 2/3/5
MDHAPAALSDRERGFDQIRKRVGFFAAPAALVVLWLLPIPSLTPPQHHLLAIVAFVVTLWMTEALPLPITALLGPTLCVLAGIGPAKEVFRSFADPIILLFLGSFLLAEGMMRHGLNRRIAFGILSSPAIARRPARLLIAFGAVTGFVSMWCSNTATAAMMYPIAIAILTEMARRVDKGSAGSPHFTELRYGTGLMLVTAFAASVGGLGTPVGTPPNLVGLGQLERTLGLRISFFDWMLIGVPTAALLIAFLVFYLNRLFPAEPSLMDCSAEWLRSQKEGLGPLTPGERNVLFAFAITVSLWILPGILALALGANHPFNEALNRRIPESVAALIGALMLFALPLDLARNEFTMTWRAATQIDWGTILLFGGGLALGDLMFNTGLANWIGEGLAQALEAKTSAALVALFTGVAIVLSETTSNTASAAMIVPVAIAVAQAAGVNPVQPALAACLGASMGSMLPVSTPPNAIVYGSGCVPLTKMMKYGILLDLAGFVVIVAIVLWLSPLVLALSPF